MGDQLWNFINKNRGLIVLEAINFRRASFMFVGAFVLGYFCVMKVCFVDD